MVIGQVYFQGGAKSFSSRFDEHFPRWEHAIGVTKPEVPKGMVALVATAVSLVH